MMRRRVFSADGGFTLIELLCVMAIIAILVGIAMPAYSSFRDKTDGVQCASNLRQIGAALQAYVGQNDGMYPEIETDPNNPIYPPEDGALGLLATLAGKGAADQQAFFGQLKTNPRTAALSGNGMSQDVVKCPADLRNPAFNYYVKYGTSYEWAPYVDDELETAPQIFSSRRGQLTVPTSKIVVCFDVERVHGLLGDFKSKKNYLYADGHVRNYWDTAPRARPKN